MEIKREKREKMKQKIATPVIQKIFSQSQGPKVIYKSVDITLTGLTDPVLPWGIYLSAESTKKLWIYLCGIQQEVGGFAISQKNSIANIEDFVVIKQTCSLVHTSLDDDAVTNHFDNFVDAGYKPESFARIWWHTHPDMAGSDPSTKDWDTFERIFSRSDWGIMLIASRHSRSMKVKATIMYNIGPGRNFIGIPVFLDWSFKTDPIEAKLFIDDASKLVKKEIYITQNMGYAPHSRNDNNTIFDTEDDMFSDLAMPCPYCGTVIEYTDWEETGHNCPECRKNISSNCWKIL